MRNISLLIKRIIDLIGSLVGLILFSPFLLIISILIKTTSEGTIFFKQERLGINGEKFYIYKFRTMISGAESKGDKLAIKSEFDARITKVGRFLRATSLDEIPQLFNVLMNSMSLVGPRPPVTYHPYDGIESYPKWTKKRFDMKPGITGLSQVKVRNAVSWEERIKIDCIYIEKFSLALDLKILFLTVIKLLKKEDVYMDYNKVKSGGKNAE